jgi:hypothetical protein
LEVGLLVGVAQAVRQQHHVEAREDLLGESQVWCVVVVWCERDVRSIEGITRHKWQTYTLIVDGRVHVVPKAVRQSANRSIPCGPGGGQRASSQSTTTTMVVGIVMRPQAEQPEPDAAAAAARSSKTGLLVA